MKGLKSHRPSNRCQYPSIGCQTHAWRADVQGAAQRSYLLHSRRRRQARPSPGVVPHIPGGAMPKPQAVLGSRGRKRRPWASGLSAVSTGPKPSESSTELAVASAGPRRPFQRHDWPARGRFSAAAQPVHGQPRAVLLIARNEVDCASLTSTNRRTNARTSSRSGASVSGAPEPAPLARSPRWQLGQTGRRRLIDSVHAPGYASCGGRESCRPCWVNPC
jgi:hypothetical protein